MIRCGGWDAYCASCDRQFDGIFVSTYDVESVHWDDGNGVIGIGVLYWIWNSKPLQGMHHTSLNKSILVFPNSDRSHMMNIQFSVQVLLNLHGNWLNPNH